MVFTTEEFFDVAIESWTDWDLSSRPLNFVQMLYTLYSYSSFIVSSVSYFILLYASVSHHVYLN